MGNDEHQIAIARDKEQCHIVQGVLGLSWSDPDRYALDVLVTILGGSGGRLFVELRDRESLAYSVAPVVNYGVDPGSFAIYLACAPAKLRQARSSIAREMNRICQTEVSQRELERAKNYLVSSHEEEMQRGDAQALTMALMENYGLGHDDFLSYSERIKKVQPSEVLAVADRLWAGQKRVEVVVGAAS